MKKILLDVDNVICFTSYLPYINEFMNANYQIDDFTECFIDKVAIPQEQFDEFIAFIRGRNLYDKAEILPMAIETIQKLNELYDIYICSSCVNPFDVEGSGVLFLHKYNYLLRILPFIHPGKYIFTNAKNIIRADVQIDDILSNLKGNIKTKILFPSYHNKTISDDELKKYGVIRAGYDWRNGWNEVGNILLKDEPKKRIYHS